jgi:hypothetical protein
MSVAAILERCRAAGVEVSLADARDQLRCHHRGALPDDVRELLTAHKPELLRYLDRQPSAYPR